MQHLQLTAKGRKLAEILYWVAFGITLVMAYTTPRDEPVIITIFISTAFALALSSDLLNRIPASKSDTPIDDAVRRDLHIKDAQ